MAQNSETNRFTFYIDEENQSTRIDSVLSLLLPETSRSFIQKLIEEGGVVLNGKPMTSKKHKAKDAEAPRLLHGRLFAPQRRLRPYARKCGAYSFSLPICRFRP